MATPMMQQYLDAKQACGDASKDCDGFFEWKNLAEESLTAENLRAVLLVQYTIESGFLMCELQPEATTTTTAASQ